MTWWQSALAFVGAWFLVALVCAAVWILTIEIGRRRNDRRR
jgi:hypothetical protein